MFRILFFLMPISLWAQVTVFDAFKDGDFNQNPTWWGDTNSFQVETGLRLNDSLAGTAYLATYSPISEGAAWYFKLRLDFNPSSSNFTDLVVMSDRDSLGQGFRGYFLRVGNSKDQICLWRSDGSSAQSLFCSHEDLLDHPSLDLEIRLSRDLDFWWRLELALNGAPFVSIDSILDSSYRLSRAAGWICNYTKTRSDRFYLDSIHWQGFPALDSVAPQIEDQAFISPKVLRLFANESVLALDSALVDGLKLQLMGGAQEADSLDLLASQSFPANDSFRLAVFGLQDPFGNKRDTFLDLYRLEANWGDLRINEIMADPSPVVGSSLLGFPEQEYLELVNRRLRPLDLKGWQLMIGAQRFALDGVELKPLEYLLLIDEDGRSDWPIEASIATLPWSTYQLKNEGVFIGLLSPEGYWIDTLSYRLEWYGSEEKSEGGWSLACKNIDLDCRGAGNWTASIEEEGGSPNALNSVANLPADTLAPKLLSVEVDRSDFVKFFFDEAIFLDSTAYSLSPELTAESLWVVGKSLAIFFKEPMQEGLLYQLDWTGALRDCFGNFWWEEPSFGLGARAPKQSVLVSEVLFNPVPEGCDFIEIYNASGQIIDLRELSLAKWDRSTNTLGATFPLTDQARILRPAEVLVLCEDEEALRKTHQAKAEQIIKMDLPSLGDEGVALVLQNAYAERVDQVEVDAAWHAPFLGDLEGVSLKRRYWEGPAIKEWHWESSSRAEGYASPGWIDWPNTALSTQAWQASEAYFSPNDDGFKDQVTFTYRFEQGGNWGQVDIFDRSGNLRRKLVGGESLSSQGSFIWYGEDDNGAACESGIYLVVLRSINDQSGESKQICNVVLSRER